jgi:urease accessory protein
MMRIDSIVGHSSDGRISEILHNLDHQNLVERVILLPEDLKRHRLKAKTDKGCELAISIPRDIKLEDGSVVYLDTKRAIVISASKQKWLIITANTAALALQLGYHAGNLHWKVRFQGIDIHVAVVGSYQPYIDRLSSLFEPGELLCKRAED